MSNLGNKILFFPLLINILLLLQKMSLENDISWLFTTRSQNRMFYIRLAKQRKLQSMNPGSAVSQTLRISIQLKTIILKLIKYCFLMQIESLSFKGPSTSLSKNSNTFNLYTPLIYSIPGNLPESKLK